MLSLVLAASMTLGGCFTTVGGLIGHSVTSPEEVRHPDGTTTTEQTPSTGTGMAIGAILDVVALVVFVRAVDSIPDEAIGRVGP
jgi:hypothetical protein